MRRRIFIRGCFRPSVGPSIHPYVPRYFQTRTRRILCRVSGLVCVEKKSHQKSFLTCENSTFYFPSPPITQDGPQNVDLNTLAETVGLLQQQLEKFQEEYCSSGSSGGSPTQTLNPFVGAPPEAHQDDSRSSLHNGNAHQMVGGTATKLAVDGDAANHYPPGMIYIVVSRRLSAVLTRLPHIGPSEAAVS